MDLDNPSAEEEQTPQKPLVPRVNSLEGMEGFNNTVKVIQDIVNELTGPLSAKRGDPDTQNDEECFRPTYS